MKKNKALTLTLAAAIILAGCKNSFENYETKTNEKTVNVEINELLSKTRVNLFPGVEISDLGISDGDRENMITSEISKKANRSVSPSETIISMQEVSEIIEKTVQSVELPELLQPTEEDIVKIQETFLDLTEDEIIKNLDTIARIYQDEISALAIPLITENTNFTDSYSQSRGVTIKDWKIYYGNVQITSYIVSAMLNHPFSAMGILNQKEKALNLTEKYMGIPNDGNNKSDSFRHAIWNIVMCKEGWGKKDAKLAWANDFATAYEQGGNYYPFSSDMDLHNNRTGRNYYNENSSKTYTKFLWWNIESGVNEPSYEEACSAIKKKAVNANFIDMTDTNFSNKLSSANENTLIYIVKDNNSY